MKTIIHKKIELTEEAVDDFSFDVQMTLRELGCTKEDIIRSRLSIEDVLTEWLSRGLRGEELEVELVKKIRHFVINLSIPGKEINPLREEDDDHMAGAELHGYIAGVTQQINYAYEAGANQISLRVAGPGVNHFVWIILAIVMAVVCGVGMRVFLPDYVPYISKGYVEPTFETLLGVLTAVVAPYVFLSLISGIITMGDPKQLNRIGKQVLMTFLGSLAAIMIVVGTLTGLVLPFSDTGAVGVGGFFQSLWNMLLQFFPTDIVTPFAEKKMMQIIALAGIFGISIVYMRESMGDVVRLILAMEKMLNSILRVICSFESILIFFGLLKVFLEDLSGVANLAVTVVVAHAIIYGIVLILLAGSLMVCLNGHVILVLRKMFPAAFIGLATASSTAAFPAVFSCCEQKLGIRHQLTSFAVPFGQVIFKIGSGIRLFLITLLCMYFYELPVNGLSILLLGFLAYMLSMMVPPVAEGSVAALTLLFTYMHVPTDALAVGIIISVFIDFVSTFINIYSNQIFILIAALKMKMVDTDTLYHP